MMFVLREKDMHIANVSLKFTSYYPTVTRVMQFYC